MFGTIFGFVGTSVTIVYPLHQSYNCIKQEKHGLLKNWLIYWIVFGLFTQILSCTIPSFLLSILPFSGFVKLYLQCWLALPLIDLDRSFWGSGNPTIDRFFSGNAVKNVKGGDITKLNGSIIIWNIYILPFLEDFDHHLNNLDCVTLKLKLLVINVYNLIKSRWIKVSSDDTSPQESNFWKALLVTIKDTNNSAVEQTSQNNPQTVDEDHGSKTSFIPSLLSTVGLTYYSSEDGKKEVNISRTGFLLKSFVSVLPIVVNGREPRSAEGAEDFDIVSKEDFHEAERVSTEEGWFKSFTFTGEKNKNE